MSAWRPVFTLSASTIICYDEFQLERRKNVLQSKNTANLTRGQFNGFMSEKTRSDLRKKLLVYYESMYSVGKAYREKKKIFHPIVTLTLPAEQKHTDNEIKRELLSRWVDKIKYNYDVRFYYWVAEKQLNQNIHFHVLLDRFIPHEMVRQLWNAQLTQLGYIRMFAEKHGHDNPNSTDIQAIRNLSRSSDYVTKYTSKVEQQGGIIGRLHGECDALKKCVKFKEEIWSELGSKLDWCESQGLLEKKIRDNFVCYVGDIRKVFKSECPNTYKRWLAQQREVAEVFYGA